MLTRPRLIAAIRNLSQFHQTSGLEAKHSLVYDNLLTSTAVARALIGGGSSARLVSFEMKLISKEVSRAEPEYMNIHPPISVLETALLASKNTYHCYHSLSAR